MSTTVKVQIQQRIDTASNWTTANPTLLAGEVGWESDTKKYKIGDGSTAWASLTYAPGSGGYTAGTGVSISASNVITASAVALTTVQTAGSQSAMLSLTTQEGDVVVRSDENKSYVRNSGTAGSMADFTLLATPTDAVLSVNGNTGAITADQLAAAIEAASDSNTFTDADHTKLNSALTTSDLLDEDNFATNSATKAASQQSVKAYVDTADALKANLSGATFTGDVVFTGDAANVTWDKSTDDLIFNDNAKAIFGTSSDGISLYHNGSHSYIDDQGTGHLIIKTSELDVMNVAGNEDMIKATQNGSVELFWDNSKKAEVVSWGLNILGNCGVGDNSKFQCGDSQDLQIWHGSNSYIDNSTGLLYVRGADTYISNANGTENIARFASNGAVENYFDNDLKLKTTSAGAVSKGSLGISTQATGNPVENDTPTLAFFGAADDTTTSARIQAKFIGTQSGSSNPTELNFYTKPASLGPGSHPLLALTLDKDQNATVTGTVSDSKGDLRSIPANAKTGAYTLTASDAGKFIPNTTGGWTIPNSVMSTGDAVTLINDSGSDQTITQGTNHTIYNTADGSTGTRTLAARGIATLIWQNSSVSYISGAGLS